MNGRTYAALVEVNETEVQNVQELVRSWGAIRSDIEEQGGRLREAYALMGGYDYLALYDADDRGTALQIAVGIERYGFDVETLSAIPVERMGELVEEI